jgi:ectoine hydroxylase-related dioxygenase (phytanoyl-CoA dioxygenase family)
MHADYEKNGFIHYKNLFEKSELVELNKTLRTFHELWLKDNNAVYQERSINSAYITASGYLSDQQRLILFQFIGQDKIASIAKMLLPDGAAFINSQLFFDPADPHQTNYWHRDLQYNHQSVEQQKAALQKNKAFHFRVPMVAERGVELVPGSHKTWDTPTEFDVRSQKNGRNNYDDLNSGLAVALEPTDLLVFSADMIHRGLYGGNRFSFDILFCDLDPNLMRYAEVDCFPNDRMMKHIKNPELFENTLHFKNGAKPSS